MSRENEKNGDKNSMEFDNKWWDFILGDEPLKDIKNAKSVSSNQPNTQEENDWDFLEKHYRNDEMITVEVYGFNKGGLLVKSDKLKGFIPVSHILSGIENLNLKLSPLSFKERIGEKINVKVVECNPATRKVVLSERAAQTENGKRKEVISCLKAGAIVQGTVTNITEFGVFVDLGGVEGLIHISELSWGRVRNTSDHARQNEKITVQVLSVNVQDMHVALSLKRLSPNPWFEIERKYKPGDVVPARISKILPYGAFACLEEGVEGLIHISALKMDDNIKDLNLIFKDNDQVMVEILQIDAKNHRLGLALVHS